MKPSTILNSMGLDANTIRRKVANEQLGLLREYLEYVKSVRVAACGNKPLYLATEEELAAYQAAFGSGEFARFKTLNLDFKDIEEVEHPAEKNPYGNVGRWRVGYGGGMDPSKNFVLGTFYQAFPGCYPHWMGVFEVDWEEARRVVLARIEVLKTMDGDSMIPALEVFLESIDYVLSQPHPETYFLSCFP